jgi:outer membrane protein assembly factor BamB
VKVLNRSGELLREYEVRKGGNLIVAGNTVFVVSTRTTYCYNLAGELQYRFDMPSSTRSPGTVTARSDGTMLVGTHEGVLLLYGKP